MKKLILTTTLSLFAAVTLYAQVYTSYQNRFDNNTNHRETIREIRLFEQELDHFSYAMMIDDSRAARIAKRQILIDMEREINQTYQLLRVKTRLAGFYSPLTKEEYRRKVGEMHSRRNGYNDSSIGREIVKIEQRLELQEHLLNRFKRMQLTARRGRIVNENEHRRIMYQFRETMNDELNHSSRQRGWSERRGRY